LTSLADSVASLKPAPDIDRVGFPKSYSSDFIILRVVNKPKENKVVTVYGNILAASVTNRSQLPYPYGSVLVMETAQVQTNSTGTLLMDAKGSSLKGSVTGLHVMRRERDFGKAYGPGRAGEWEFVEYKPDATFITPPQKSATCAECHIKAGTEKDYVYQARLGTEALR
jgi:hypothetical protein